MHQTTSYTKDVKPKTITFDVKGRVLGRIATEIANVLRGKNKTDFSYHQIIGDKVIIKNAKYVKVTGQKMTDKKYYRHSGYLGGLKEESLKDLLKRRPKEVIRRAVTGMLPKNRLQSKWLNNLIIYEEEIGDM